MSSFTCQACGNDAPLSEPCPVCEPLVTRALAGDYDLKPTYMPLPREETRALLARIEAMRVDRSALVEQLAQKNREIQTLRERDTQTVADGLIVLNKLTDAQCEIRRLRSEIAKMHEEPI